jgi:large conductance mechanosensitive channel
MQFNGLSAINDIEIYNFLIKSIYFYPELKTNIMKLVDEFKAFAMKGNVIDMAVGIIIGAAFGKIVASMVSDVLMPPLGLLIGGVTFTDLKFVLKSAVGENPAVTLNYGNFLQVVFDFLIVAFIVFMMIKAMNAARKKHVAPPPAPPVQSKEEILLTEIRDLLKK